MVVLFRIFSILKLWFNFYSSAEREEGRLRAEIKKLERELDVIKERKNIYEV